MKKIFVLILFCVSTNVFAIENNCDKLKPLECLKSLHCRLDCDRISADFSQCIKHSDYHCKSKVGECEDGLKQENLTKQICESKKNCEFQEANCFCPCDFKKTCTCVCAGGPPNRCIDSPT